MSRRPDADRAWQTMAHFVIDHRGPWRRALMARTGLPFTHVRLLRRLRGGPLSISDLAEAAAIDPPAATVAVTALQRDGLVQRSVDPTNRRRKVVSLTDAGHELVDEAMRTDDPAPPNFDALDDTQIAQLSALLAILADDTT
ncbi:MarR family winged helix-turn-helix transcriptional regulator [Williamsia sp. CHRR-6]|uniref:MarR family winged helix-turn-helix transcriptional regulator n=1 Tax=Williamsia sp. CHRR-6 TaxID=2835871 RepID=UPI001BDA15B1|nr:MarR family transcriptional regulator [Williamsia sp. CHRR-6]MBT0567113.1 MarR family transcriptional regulator [Williamsia sp. CHRR-6]